MIRFLLFSLLVFTLPHAALAADNPHVRSAFQFAEKDDWSNAIAHAKASGNPVLVKLITWEYILDQDSGATFAEIVRFIDNNPKWPEQKRLHIRAEMSLKTNDVPDHDIISWFGDDMPITGVGKVALAEALIRNKMANPEKINYLIRDAWRNGDFEEPQERHVLDAFGAALKREDHIGRIDRLLWEEKTAQAKRVLDYAPEPQQRLFRARMALIENRKLAVISVAEVPSSLKSDAGLIYDRMRYKARHGDDDGVREMLLAAPEHPPYPEKWWRAREIQVREAIDEKQFGMAKKLLANNGQVDGQGLADSIWLMGWLKSEFTDQPHDAYEDFTSMYGKVKFPVSKARAAYWAARAADKAGDKEAAHKWYDAATAYPTTFYGQLASLKLNGTKSLDIPSSPSVSPEEKRNFERNDIVQAIKLCIQMNELDLAGKLIAMVIENSDDEAEVALLADLGMQAGHKHLSVRAAKKALQQQNVVLVNAGYPTPKTPVSRPVERALTLAITRQESEFDPNAKSPSGAIGMMQLLPSTAKEVAKKHGMKFAKARMNEPDYNMQLGSYYLQRLVNSYDGSYIMAVAAYNAGPGNVRNWSQSFGTPNNNIDNAVNWIEKIPYTETRNYVQRVLENLQVYRNIEANGKAKLALGEDLMR